MIVEVKEQCDKCGQFAGLDKSPEGQVCGVCDEWICNECEDRAVSLFEYKLHDGTTLCEDVICKECSENLKLKELTHLGAV